ncbi:MAG: alanine--tRNA ligase, partial [Clostridia bacterium]|nr:alanine--tRNA ligase [Clostridia bacterium]
FKTEAIHWAWEFLTSPEWLDMPKEKLWVTIYLDDDEAFDIWNKEIGMPAERIVRLGKEDNFWEHGSGPCGPCSEIHYDRGEEFGCGSPDCKPGCDCDRYMEFWNLVFTQFDSDGKGTYTRLAKPNIDTGMGLERLACIFQNVNNLFEVDTVRNIMLAVSEKSGVNYGDDAKSDISLRVITDHIRGGSFMVCDGVVPSNEGRGYVLRRLLRRAARHGRMIGIKGLFLADIVDVVARENYSEYPELTEKIDYIKKIISIEEERFAATIDSGLEILSGMTKKAIEDGSSVISGEDVFKLYDTFGFPIDLTREIAAENSLTIDEEKFTALMAEQKKRAREARANISGWSEASKSLLSDFAKTEFCGYTENTVEAKVIGIISDDESVESVSEGEFSLILDKTVFYGEGGGQVGDTGMICAENLEITVNDTKKSDGVFLHICEITNGSVKVGDTVTLKVDTARRNAIKRNHSSCHLLQAALREVLGAHVEQAGSYVDADRVRFDFKHFSALTKEELERVEARVNEEILAGYCVDTKEMDIESARATGAMALFGEKYGKTVRVVKMGDFSTELCGGTHVDNTSKVGLFKIITETSVAAGVRRIEGTTGLGVLKMLEEKDALISTSAQEMKLQNPADLAKRSASLMGELKDAKSEIASLEAKIANVALSSLKNSGKDVKGMNLIVSKVEGVSLDAVRAFTDDLRASDSKSIVIIALVDGARLNFVASCGKDAVSSGAMAGKIVKEVATICNGGGGGRPDSATAGGKDVSKLPEALEKAYSIVEAMIK